MTEKTITLPNGKAIRLRPAHPDDAADLIEIARQVVEENISNVGNDVDSLERSVEKLSTLSPLKLWLVAEHEGSVVGALTLNPLGPNYTHHLRQLGIEVHRNWRGSGVGSALIRHGIEWARNQGVEALLLGVLDTNPRARALYERLGFQVIGHIPCLVKRPDGSYADDTEMMYVIREPDA